MASPWPNKPLYSVDLSGKTAMVVGANTGIGIEAAKHLAKMNADRVIITCRTDEKGAIAAEAIKKELKPESKTKVEPWALELSSFASVVAFADKFEKDGGKLDVVIINAAVADVKVTRTGDGWETQIQVNHLSNALLSLLLLPVLSKTATQSPGSHPRLLIVSSGLHKRADFGSTRFPEGRNILTTLNDVQELNTKDESTTAPRYGDTKLMNVLFARALTAHLPPTSPIIVNNVCPGFCHSDLRRHMEDKGQWDELLKLARTSEEGARQLIYAALAGEKEGEDLDKFRAAYVEHAEVASAGPWVSSEEGKKIQEVFWNETLDVIAKASPKVRGIVSQYLTN